MRYVGTTTAKSSGVKVNGADVFVTADSFAEVRIRRSNGNYGRTVTLAPEVLVDLAQQLLAAHLTIKERWGIKE